MPEPATMSTWVVRRTDGLPWTWDTTGTFSVVAGPRRWWAQIRSVCRLAWREGWGAVHPPTIWVTPNPLDDPPSGR